MSEQELRESWRNSGCHDALAWAPWFKCCCAAKSIPNRPHREWCAARARRFSRFRYPYGISGTVIISTEEEQNHGDD